MALTPRESDDWARIQKILQQADDRVRKGSWNEERSLRLMPYALIGKAAAATSTLHRYGVSEFADLDGVITALTSNFEVAVRLNLRDLYEDLGGDGAEFDFRDLIGPKP